MRRRVPRKTMNNAHLTPLRNADVDGDSTMHSSPDVEADDDLFPGEGPSTPRNAASFAPGPASELSPPNSQGRFQEESLSTQLAGGADPPSIINANGKRAHPNSVANTNAATSSAAGGQGDRKAGPVQTDKQTGYQWTSPEDAPGYEWRSNRAREDESRAMDLVQDKASMIRSKSVRGARGCSADGRSIARYGDPLNPDVPMTLKR